MNKYHSLLLATALLLGSAQLSAADTYSAYVPTKKSVINPNDSIKVKNGQLEFHGKTILDEDGDINMGFNIKDKLYYFVTKESANVFTYTLKDASGKEIRKFAGERVHLMSSSEGLPLILVQLKQDSNSYDNVYTFDGENVKLIAKNFKRYQNEFYAGGYQIMPASYGDGNFAQQYYPIKSVSTGETKTFGTLHPTKPMFGDPDSKRMIIFATAGSNLIYLYEDIDDNRVIETYNTKTGEQQTIAKGKGVFQFLTNGDKKLLRTFKDKTLAREFLVDRMPTTEYQNKESTYLDLATLEEVSIDQNEYKIYMFDYVNTVRFRFLTVALDRSLEYAMYDHRGRPLF
jgi:hypothetical protein